MAQLGSGFSQDGLENAERLIRQQSLPGELVEGRRADHLQALLDADELVAVLGFEHPGTDGSLPLVLEPKVDQYLSLVMRLIFAFGVCFELPVLMILLAKVGIVTSKGLAKKRKYAILIAFVVAAVLTPPDVISQVLLAIPVAILYEISIIGARIIEKKRGDQVDDEDDDEDEDETSSSTAT